MSELENMLYAAAKAIVHYVENTEPTTQATQKKSNSSALVKYDDQGIPSCTIHGKQLRVSKSPRDVSKDYYYCPTKDDNTGKWCSAKAGK